MHSSETLPLPYSHGKTFYSDCLTSTKRRTCLNLYSIRIEPESLFHWTTRALDFQALRGDRHLFFEPECSLFKTQGQGKEIFNVDTQHKVRFTSEGRGEAFSGIKHSIDAHVVNVLARLVRRAVHVNAIDPDGRRHSDTKKFHCFVAPLRINNEFYAVKLTFREALMSTLGVSHLKFYDVAILKDKIKSPLGHGLSAESTNYPSHVGLSVNIDHLLEVFNGNNEKHRDAWKEKTQEKSFSQSIIFCRRVGHS